VFPWVIADYSSSTLDLTKPETFRDLSRPMGSYFPKKREESIARYESFCDPSIPRFHHGTHWLTLGAVLHYLIRMEPFTTYFLEFQGGHFDHVNRMFLGPGLSFQGAAVDTSCTKELIPEFFYLPEFLRNSNRFNFGLPVGDPAPTDANGLVQAGVGDAILPPWAEGSAEKFVRLNRMALESDYVSEHLNEWIDLIWGYKQRGKEAIDAVNTFFYLTYDNCVDPKSLEDPVMRQPILSQIFNFGQMPSQLFTTPHPRRIVHKEAEASAPADTRLSSSDSGVILQSANGLSSPISLVATQSCSCATESNSGEGIAAFSQQSQSPSQSSQQPSGSVTPQQVPDSILTVERSGRFYVSSLAAVPNLANSQPFTFVDDRIHAAQQNSATMLAASPTHSPSRGLGSLLSNISSNLLGVGSSSSNDSSDGSGRQVSDLPSASRVHLSRTVAVSFEEKLLFVGGVWDGKVYIRNWTGKLLDTIPAATDIVTCVSYSHGFLVTGSRDCSVAVYDMRDFLKTKSVPQQPIHALTGHTGPIACVVASEDNDLVISSSYGESPSCLLHTLRTGEFLRSIRLRDGPIDQAFIASDSTLATFASTSGHLSVSTVNGNPLGSLFIPKEADHEGLMGGFAPPLAVSASATYIAVTFDGVSVDVLTLHDLQPACRFKTGEQVVSFSFACHDTYLVAGLASGVLKAYNVAAACAGKPRP